MAKVYIVFTGREDFDTDTIAMLGDLYDIGSEQALDTRYAIFMDAAKAEKFTHDLQRKEYLLSPEKVKESLISPQKVKKYPFPNAHMEEFEAIE